MNQNRAGCVWLELLRAPNLLTVPGDVLAGFALAGGAQGQWPVLVVAGGAGLALYVAGLAINDYADRAEDFRERPGRPIPSGRLSPVAVLLTGLLALGLGLGAAGLSGSRSLAVAVILSLAIIAYNYGLKRLRGIGALNMGLCRGLNLLLGASVAGQENFLGALPLTTLLAAISETLLVAVVTSIAAHETETRRLGFWRWLPGVVSGMALLMLAACTRWPSDGVGRMLAVLFTGVLAVGWFLAVGHALRGTPSPVTVGRGIGAWIRGLLLLQACFCALAVQAPWSLLAACLLLLLLPVAGRLGRSFAGS
ncbi:MAG: UbiA family prenyltransferase [bacterium]